MKNRFNLLYQPETTWRDIKAKQFTIPQVYLRFLIFMALVPVLAAFIGSVYVGWQVGSQETTKLTSNSALTLSAAAYIGMLLGAYIFAQFIRWMAQTYGSKASLANCFALVVYSATPLFLASIVSVYPILWLDTLITLVALAFSIKLLFIGTPIMMDVNVEKGFLFSNSILAVAMVLSVGAIAISVLFWGAGIAPEFTQ